MWVDKPHDPGIPVSKVIELLDASAAWFTSASGVTIGNIHWDGKHFRGLWNDIPVTWTESPPFQPAPGRYYRGFNYWKKDE